MATLNELLLYFILTAFILSATTATTTAVPYPPPVNTSYIAAILSSLGYQELSSAAANVTLFNTPATIFAPTASSLRSCGPSCSSVPLLLQQYSVPDILEFNFLGMLVDGSKIGSFAPKHCLTVTSFSASDNDYDDNRRVFVNGLEVINPEIYNDGHVVVYSLKKGRLYPPSPRSCFGDPEIYFPMSPMPTSYDFVIEIRLREAIRRLSGGGFHIVASAIKHNIDVLWGLRRITIFAVDDESMKAWKTKWRLEDHLLFDVLLTGAKLGSLSSGTALPTWRDESLVVTSGVRDGGSVRINYARVKRFDMVKNDDLVIHGLSMPFRKLDYPLALITR